MEDFEVAVIIAFMVTLGQAVMAGSVSGSFGAALAAFMLALLLQVGVGWLRFRILHMKDPGHSTYETFVRGTHFMGFAMNMIVFAIVMMVAGK